ncbi:MAG: hypothetical protein GX638_00160 [Crenarchaeota archaeon]|nr:hypothetical protein [Thermoproteota archaeon]
MLASKYLIRSMVNPNMEYTIVSDVKASYGSKVKAEAVFQKCDDANANGMRFPKRVLYRAVEDIQNEVKSRHFLGELDHPDDINDINRISTVSLKSVSHVVTSLKMDGSYVVGSFETLDTPNGAILASLLKDKIKVGVSIRAVTDQNVSYGLENIDTIEDFNLISYDAVHNPAYSDAYVNSVMASVFKIPSNSSNNKKLLQFTEEEFKSIISAAVLQAVKKLSKK